MENLADFKKFVQSRPELSEAVKNQEYTWQGIYEMYALYGPDHAIWQDFKGKSVSSAGGGLDIASLLNLVRNLDLDALASALSGLEESAWHRAKRHGYEGGSAVQPAAGEHLAL